MEKRRQIAETEIVYEVKPNHVQRHYVYRIDAASGGYHLVLGWVVCEGNGEWTAHDYYSGEEEPGHATLEDAARTLGI